MRGERVRWVLAYDIGCAQCRTLSQSVQDAGDGELEILPLNDSLVRSWVARARPGRPMQWQPMLIRVDGDGPARADRSIADG